MLASSTALTAAAWILTYLIHSTLLLAGAWGLEALFALESMRLRERLWRVALLGGLLTAGVQLALGLEIPAPRWALDRAAPAVAAEPASADFPALERSLRRPLTLEAADSEPGLLRPRQEGAGRSAGRSAFVELAAERLAAPGPGTGSLPARATEESAAPTALERLAAAVPHSPAAWVALVASAAALAVLAELALSAARLRRRLAGAVELHEGPEIELLAELARRARLGRRVRLFVAPRLCSPLSSGLLCPAVYVPPRALDELSAEEREAMLAHELAHVARRDPAWLTIFWLIERACFFQPLNRLARRRLAHSAEVLADDWAVRYTGRHLSLASCLARIAGWMTEGPRLLGAHLTDGGADGERPRSQLGRRIERLLESRHHGEEARHRWWSPLALGVLGSLALVAPGVAARRPAAAPEPVSAHEVPPAPVPVPAPAANPLALPAPSGPRAAPVLPAPPASTDLADELCALDEEVELLAGELDALGRELEGYRADPALAQLLAALEAHAGALAERRDRLLAHTLPTKTSGVRP